MKVLDLFSGIGGFSLGLERAGMETVAFCEIDPYCRRVLAKHWPGVPIYDDITTLAYDSKQGLERQQRAELQGHGMRSTDGGIDVICGGFPCQPFSQAGKRGGASDHRALWPEMFRLIREVQPAWVIGENVTGIINMELDTVLSDLEGEGYACQTFVIPACGVDAPHRRDRVWIVGHADREGESTGAVDAQAPGVRSVGHAGRTNGERHTGGVSGAKAPGCSQGQQDGHMSLGSEHAGEGGLGAVWKPEPPVGRVVNGIPRRVDRLRALGNAVVPQVVEQIGRAIMDHGHHSR